MRFKKGDCIILDMVDAPATRNICVITCIRNGLYFCKYLNADPRLSRYNRPPRRGTLDDATLLADFGVQLVMKGRYYWCEAVGVSNATYRDGRPRSWQDRYCVHHVSRPDVAKQVRP